MKTGTTSKKKKKIPICYRDIPGMCVKKALVTGGLVSLVICGGRAYTISTLSNAIVEIDLGTLLEITQHPLPSIQTGICALTYYCPSGFCTAAFDGRV